MMIWRDIVRLTTVHSPPSIQCPASPPYITHSSVQCPVVTAPDPQYRALPTLPCITLTPPTLPCLQSLVWTAD